jgi:hypothetical protein
MKYPQDLRKTSHLSHSPYLSQMRIIGDFIRFSLMDLNGSIILQGNKHTVDISNLLSGFYLVKIDTRMNTLVRKIVKK